MIPRMSSTMARLPRPTPPMTRNLLGGSPTSLMIMTTMPTPRPPTPELQLKGVRLTLPLSNFWLNGVMRVVPQTLVTLMQLLAPNLRRCLPSVPGRPVPPPLLLAKLQRPRRLLERANRLKLPPLGSRLAQLLLAGPGVDLS